MIHLPRQGNLPVRRPILSVSARLGAGTQAVSSAKPALATGWPRSSTRFYASTEIRHIGLPRDKSPYLPVLTPILSVSARLGAGTQAVSSAKTALVTGWPCWSSRFRATTEIRHFDLPCDKLSNLPVSAPILSVSNTFGWGRSPKIPKFEKWQ